MPSLTFRKGAVLPVIAVLALFGGCTAVEDNDTSSTILVVQSMTTDGGLAELFSDVCRAQNAGTANPTCSVVNDNGQVTVAAFPKDQLRANGQFNTVYFTRYRVTYVRADGRGVPGVEVPYPFDGATNFSVSIGTPAQRSFMIVRQQAKLESPLINLQRAGQGLILSVLARVDFYGSDVAGRPVTVTGYLNITFADFPDT